MNINTRHVTWFSLGLLGLIAGYSALQAWNSRTTPEKVAEGGKLFLHDWSENDPLCEDGDGLGPVFNARSCVDCHWQGGVGGGGGNESNVVAFAVRPDRRIGRNQLGGGVVHAEAISDAMTESIDQVKEMYPVIEGGTRVVGGCTVRFSPLNPVAFTEINTPHLFGAGLIDEISSTSIALQGSKRMAVEIAKGYKPGLYSGNGMGRTHTINGFVGKFGWKGQFVSLEDFVAAACANELGLTNPLKSQMVAKEFVEDQDAELDMSRRQLNDLVCFVRNLPRPEQVLPEDVEMRERAIKGEELFVEVACNDCHVKTIGGVEGVYSDFHLYSIENPKRTSYFRGEIQEPFLLSDSEIQLDQWKTPPLWGVADTAPYFHDGGSATLQEAIDRHDGQARHSMKLYEKLTDDEKEMIVEFLGTLRTPKDAQPIPEVIVSN